MSSSKTFISYSSRDVEFARKLATDLRKAGVDIWMDKLDLRAGIPWDQQIEKALRAAGSFLVILTQDSVDSDTVSNEISFALKQGKKVIPVMFKTCDIPLRIHRLHYADFTSEYEQGFQSLLQTFDIAVPEPYVSTVADKPVEKKPADIKPIKKQEKSGKNIINKEKSIGPPKPEKPERNIVAKEPVKKERPADTGDKTFSDIYVSKKWLSSIEMGRILFTEDSLTVDAGGTDVIQKRMVIADVDIKKYEGKDWIVISYRFGKNDKKIYLWSTKQDENDWIKWFLVAKWKLAITEPGIPVQDIKLAKSDNDRVLATFGSVSYNRDLKKDLGQQGELYVRSRSLEFKNAVYPDEPQFKIERIIAVEFLDSAGETGSKYMLVKYKEGQTIRKIYFNRFSFLALLDSPTVNMYNGIKALIDQGKFILESQ